MNGLDIAKLEGIWEMFPCDLKRKSFDFAAPDGADAGTGGGELPPADAIKKTAERQLVHIRKTPYPKISYRIEGL